MKKSYSKNPFHPNYLASHDLYVKMANMWLRKSKQIFLAFPPVLNKSDISTPIIVRGLKMLHGFFFSGIGIRASAACKPKENQPFTILKISSMS